MATGLKNKCDEDTEFCVTLRPEYVAIGHGGTIKLDGEILPQRADYEIKWYKDLGDGPELIDTGQIKYAGTSDSELVINRVEENDACDYHMEVSLEKKTSCSKKSVVHLFGHKHRNILTVEENNFVRFVLLIKISEDALTILFDKLIPPSTLNNHLLQYENKLAKKCTEEQYNILFPDTGTKVSSADFDTTLIYKLIRNTCSQSNRKNGIRNPKNGWGNDPDKKSIRIGDDLERIRFHRNFTFHKKRWLSLEEFDEKWNDLSEAIHRICDRKLDDEVAKLKVKHLDIGVDLVQSFEDTDQLEYEKWKDEDNVFIKTRAYYEAMLRIRTTKCVAIIGGPGAGKVTTARHCALVLQEEGWKIIAVSCVKQIRQQMRNSQNHVYVIENPIGRYKLNHDECENLKEDESFLESILSSTKGKIKLIFTARRSIYREAQCLKFFIFQDKYIVDLESKEFQLNSEEMQKMFARHCFTQKVDPQFMNLKFQSSETDAPRLRGKAISTKELRGIPSNIPKSIELDLNEYPMFPLLCRIFARNSLIQKHGITFFKEPCDTLIKQLEEMCLFEKEKYCALVLCMLGGNVVTEETYENQELLRDIFKVCGEIPIRKLQEAYVQMQGTFIVHTDYGFSISSDILFEVLACKHASENPRHLLKYMNSKFISSHSYFSRPTIHNNRALSILLPRTLLLFTELSERLYSDLQQKKYRESFDNECMKDTDFQCFFADFLNKIDCGDIFEIFLKPLSHCDDYFSIKSSMVEELTKVDIYKSAFLVNQQFDGSAWVQSARGINWVIGYGHCDVLLTIVKKSEEYLSSNKGIFGFDTKEQTRMLILGCYSKNISVVEVLLKYVDRCCIDSEYEGTYTPLIAACQTGKEDIVECLILAGADVNRASTSYYNVLRTPLIVVVENNHLHLMKLLLKYNADLNKCNFEMESPYNIACRLGNSSIADLLRANDADVDTTPLVRAIRNSRRNAIKLLLNRTDLINKADSSGMTPLHWAVHCNDLVSVEQLISSGAQLIMDDKGFTPFDMACCSGFSSAVEVFYKTRDWHRRIEKVPLQTPVLNELIKARNLPVIKYLLYHGADPNHINEGELPLCVACAWGNVFIVNCLLNYSANVNECDNVYGSPLHAAAQNGRLTVTGVLLRKGACSDVLYNGSSPLHIATKYGYFDVVRCLVENGSNVNSKDDRNFTAFHHAVNENHLDIAKYLVQEGTDIDFSDTQEDLLFKLLKNYDVLMCLIRHGGIVQKAVAGNRLDIIKLLVENISPLAKADIFRYTPINFILATEKGNIEMIEYFITNGVDINAQDTHGRYPLMSAIINDHYEIVNILLDHGASTTVRDVLQRTPLHWVAERQCPNLVDTLMAHGSKINAQDIDGKTPLHRACESSNLLLVQTLSDNDADISISDNNGHTPIDIAFMNEERHIYEYLIRRLHS
ncbi:uncharacterized protein LOC130047888 [Ostrea edulis]|uniref:uncharacterized protein LOC130047888 n=1 Tax=Ostrea edulis TaxID=37623 RepID=UPI0024AECC91|nr:uncharacterized protein LOC130047888 [Ostrea edulis]